MVSHNSTAIDSLENMLRCGNQFLNLNPGSNLFSLASIRITALRITSEKGRSVFPRKHRTETPIERIFREVTGRKMNRMEKRYFLRKHRPKRRGN